MEILEVSAKEYSEVISMPYHIYGSSTFNELNRTRCDEVYFLLFKEGKYRLGIVGGQRNRSFLSPFSAPFGGFSFISVDVRLQYIEEAIRLLVIWAEGKKFSSIIITLPPLFNESSFNAKQLSCLWRERFEISKIDLNYSFKLKNIDENYKRNIWRNARKNLRISLNAGLDIKICESNDEMKLAYNLIRNNRESHGYPLRMSWKQVSETVQILQSDFFLVFNDKQIPIASAIVFYISKMVVQVIYWGDLQGYSSLRPMNFLSFKLFEHYRSIGIEIVDIGPSTENSIPNYGLCEFKESIGCEISPKYTLKKNLS